MITKKDVETIMDSPQTIQPLRERRALLLCGRRVLLAQNDRIGQLETACCLKKLAVICDIAASGKIAVDMYRSARDGHYDAILLTRDLPDMDITALASAIKGAKRDYTKPVKIIALTDSEIDEGADSLFDARVSTPVDALKLQRAFEEAYYEN